MAKKNLSLYQQNKTSELAFWISDYIKESAPSSYEQFIENDGKTKKGEYALKNAIYNVLKFIYLPVLDEDRENLEDLFDYLISERNVYRTLILQENAPQKYGKYFCEISAIIIELEELFLNIENF